MENQQLEMNVIKWEPLEEVISQTIEEPVCVDNDDATTMIEETSRATTVETFKPINTSVESDN